jgi:hypothetical protein
MAEAALPSLADARRWIGAQITDVDGAVVGEAHGLFVDAESGEPVWLIARVGRRRASRLVAIGLRECAGAPFGVWVTQPGEALRKAPVVDPTRPLRREHELTISAHFGVGEGVGRAAEVATRPQGAITATPPRD